MQQSYKTAQYQGNMQGHDANLRSDSQRPSSSSSSFGSPVQSQYRGFQRQYQPLGNVQSSYQGGMSQSQSGSQWGSSQSQMGSSQLGSSQWGSSQSQMGSQLGSSQMGMGMGQGQFANANQYHTANYVGNQQGHDASLRSDATQPSSSGGFGMASNQYHTANYAGNQQGHDSSLRSDSTQPSGSFGSAGSQSFQQYRPTQFQSSFQGSSQMNSMR